MEKNNKGLLCLIILLTVLVLGLGGYLIYDKVLAPSNDSPSTTTTTTTTAPIESNLILEESFDYMLNNTNHKITYKYYYIQNSSYNAEEFGDNYLYNVSAVVFLDNNIINGSEKDIYYGFESADMNRVKDILKGNVNEAEYQKQNYLLDKNNLMTLKGADKDYLVLNIYTSYGVAPGGISPQIINDKGVLLYTAKILEGSTVYYVDKNKSKPYQNTDGSFNQFYINQDKLNYITFNCEENGPFGAFEYTLTVANDKVNRTEILIPSGQYDGAGAKC